MVWRGILAVSEKCADCGAKIVWGVIETGERVPFDARALVMFKPQHSAHMMKQKDVQAVVAAYPKGSSSMVLPGQWMVLHSATCQPGEKRGPEDR